jgi:hypothetical protein
MAFVIIAEQSQFTLPNENLENLIDAGEQITGRTHKTELQTQYRMTGSTPITIVINLHDEEATYLCERSLRLWRSGYRTPLNIDRR